jgi:hypothetical protein
VTGQFDHQKAFAQITHANVINKCRQVGKNKALIDFSKLEGDIAASIKVLYTMKISELYNNHLESGGMPLKIAYVGSPNKISSNELGSEVARREGLPTILTTNKKEALLWLGVST